MRVKTAYFLLLTLVAASCSTTRTLTEGQYRLVSNRLELEGEYENLSSKDLSKNLTQRTKSWSPMLWVYNWAGKRTDTVWSKAMRKIGVAPVIYDPSSIAGSSEAIKAQLQYQGYYNSDVDTATTVKGKKISVEYTVTPGRRYPISEINYVLPARGDVAEDFYKDSASVTIHPGNYLSEESLDAETIRSAAYFRKLGYYGFTKNLYSFEADTSSVPGYASLEMMINEYARNESETDAVPLQRYTFGTVDMYYPTVLKFREKVLRGLNMIYPGEIYSEDVVANTYNRLSAVRVFSTVKVELSPTDSATVNCNINLSPSRLQGFKVNMEASSNSSGLLGVSPELTFYHKNIFRGGEWLNLSFMGNFQFRFNSDVSATESGISAGISFPKFIFLPYDFFHGSVPRTDFKVSWNYQDRPEYVRSIISTSFGYSGSVKKLFYQIYPLQLNIVRLFNIDENFYASLADNPFMRNAYQNHFDLSLGGTLYYTTDASVNPRSSYHYLSCSFNLAGNLLSLLNPLMRTDDAGSHKIWNVPYSQYVRGEVRLGKTWRFGKDEKHSFASRILAGAGYAYGNSTVLPFEQQFYSGGAGSLRGWQARGIGPGMAKPDESFVIPSQTGDVKLEANVEYRFPLFWKLEGAAFVDAGNIWALSSSSSYSADENARLTAANFIKSIAADWGLGIRIDLTFILLRLDLGLQVYDPSGDYGERWIGPGNWLKYGNRCLHFGVGYPF